MSDAPPPPEIPPRDTKPPLPSYDPLENDAYFGEYAKMNIHCAMLHDDIRTGTYYKAVTQNPDVFKGKVVLDVGCGTAVLSCFAAHAGAKKVYAVEASGMWEHAQLVVYRNKLQDVVQVIHSKMEDVELPEKVDVIISEWMGSFLVFECMLDTVLMARDRYLRPGGVMLPAIGRIFTAPFSYDRYWGKRTTFLNDVYGLDLSCLRPIAIEELTQYCIRGRRFDADLLLSEGKKVVELDLLNVKIEELQRFVSPLEFEVAKDANLHGFLFWFDVDFPLYKADADGALRYTEALTLSTDPHLHKTHWKQDLFFIGEGMPVNQGDKVTGLVRIIQNPDWRRHYNMEFSLTIKDKAVYKLVMS